MNWKSLTFPQVALCAVLLAGVIATYKLFGEAPAGVMLVLSSVINLLLGRSASPSEGGS
jgi:hypothetical protein